MSGLGGDSGERNQVAFYSIDYEGRKPILRLRSQEARPCDMFEPAFQIIYIVQVEDSAGWIGLRLGVTKSR